MRNSALGYFGAMCTLKTSVTDRRTDAQTMAKTREAFCCRA